MARPPINEPLLAEALAALQKLEGQSVFVQIYDPDSDFGSPASVVALSGELQIESHDDLVVNFRVGTAKLGVSHRVERVSEDRSLGGHQQLRIHTSGVGIVIGDLPSQQRDGLG